MGIANPRQGAEPVAERGRAIEHPPLDVNAGVPGERQQAAQQLGAAIARRGGRDMNHAQPAQRLREVAQTLNRLLTCEPSVVAERAATGLDPLQAAPHRLAI